MCKLARKITSSPLAPVAVERLFSKATYLLSNKTRSRMTDESVISLLILRDRFMKNNFLSCVGDTLGYEHDYK